MLANGAEKIEVQNISNWDYLAKNPRSVRGKVAICYAGRSGSMMLSGLLDGHSHLISFHCYCDTRLYLLLKEFSERGDCTVASFVEYMDQQVNFILDSFFEHPFLPQQIRQNRLDHAPLLSEIRDICRNVTDKEMNLDLMLNIVFIAFGKTLDRPLKTKQPVLVIQIHVPFMLDGWRYVFDNLSNLNLFVMTRNTIKAIDSHFYHHTYESISPPWHTFYERIVVEYQKSFMAFFDEKMSKQSYCVFYEDLHNDTEKSMRDICEHLNIPFEPILLEETMVWQKAMLPTAGEVVCGTSPARAKNITPKIMSTLDVALVEYIYRDIIGDLGYKERTSRFIQALSVIIPTRLMLLYTWRELKDYMHSRKTVRSEQTGLRRKLQFAFVDFKEMLRIFVRMFFDHRRVAKMRIRKTETPYSINRIGHGPS